MRSMIAVLTFFVFALISYSSGAADHSTPSQAQSACTESERWTFSSKISPEWREELRNLLAHRASPVHGFTQALALRRMAETPEMKLFSEYWISRALIEARLIHIAHRGLVMVAASPVTAETIGIQTSAIECLNRLSQKYPSLPVSHALVARLKEYGSTPGFGSRAEIVWEYAENAVRSSLSEGAKPKDLQIMIALLGHSGAHAAASKGLIAALQSNHGVVIKELENLLAGSLPNSLKRHTDQLRLILARSYFTQGKFNEAISQFKLIKKSSNELAKALSEMSWSFLKAERYGEAIGTATNLEAGGLRHTFAPEAPMVMAMALNELCQFPESLKAVGIFRRHYDKPYRWLEGWWHAGGNSPLYPLAIDFIQKRSNVPERLASEWVRSPVFISMQDEINLIYDEGEASLALGRLGSKEQRLLGDGIRKLGQEIKKKLQPARGIASTHPMTELKNKVILYKRFRSAAPVWRAILAAHQMQIPQARKKLIDTINLDLRSRSMRMFETLAEIAENNQLLEVEIYNGAGQDIIWQNAHPDYKQIAQRLRADFLGASANKTWDWGHALAANDEVQEVWEDELGSFNAEIYDNCSSKDKYLALRQQRK